MPTHLHVALLHPRRDLLLVADAPVPTSGGPRLLPAASLDNAHWHADHGPLTEALSGAVGRPLRLVRRLAQVQERDPSGDDEDALTTRRILFLAEPDGDGDPLDCDPLDVDPWDEEPAGWSWRAIADVADGLGAPDAAWLQPALRQLAQDLAAGSTPPLRPPWAVERSAWWGELRDWLAESLAAAGREARGDLRPVKVWGLAAVYRQETDRGPVFLKVAAPAPPLFVDEAAVTACLAELHPGCMPLVLAAKPGLGWLLLEGEEAAPRVEEGEAGAAERRRRGLELARVHAALQVASVGQAETLLTAGCIDRRLDRLADAVAPLLADPLLGEVLGAERWAQLRAAEVRIHAAIARTAELGMPAALVHGDLHLGNVLWRAGAPVLIDWTDACIGPPLVDLIALFWDDDPALSAAWREAYAEAWQDLVPRAVLDEAWELNRILLPLHHCVSYQSLQRHVEGFAGGGDVDGGLRQFGPALARALGIGD